MSTTFTHATGFVDDHVKAIEIADDDSEYRVHYVDGSMSQWVPPEEGRSAHFTQAFARRQVDAGNWKRVTL